MSRDVCHASRSSSWDGTERRKGSERLFYFFVAFRWLRWWGFWGGAGWATAHTLLIWAFMALLCTSFHILSLHVIFFANCITLEIANWARSVFGLWGFTSQGRPSDLGGQRHRRWCGRSCRAGGRACRAGVGMLCPSVAWRIFSCRLTWYITREALWTDTLSWTEKVDLESRVQVLRGQHKLFKVLKCLSNSYAMLKYVMVLVAMMISLCFSGPFDRMAKSAPTCGREFHHQCWRDPWQHLMHVWCTCDARDGWALSLCHVFFQSADQLLTCLLPFTATALHFVGVCVCVCPISPWMFDYNLLSSYAFWDGANWGFQNLGYLMFISQASRGWWAAGPTDVTRPDTAVEWANGVSATYTICYVFLGLPDVAR